MRRMPRLHVKAFKDNKNSPNSNLTPSKPEIFM